MPHRVLALVLAAVLPTSPVGGDARDRATLCLDPLGINRHQTCRSYSASLLSREPDICVCDGPELQVEARYCAAGERPPAEDAASDRARYAAATRGGTLVGWSYRGRGFCVARPRP